MAKKNQTNQLADVRQLELFGDINSEYQVKETKEYSHDSRQITNSFDEEYFLLDFKNESRKTSENIMSIDNINGLTYVRNFISQAEHDLLLKKIHSQPWLTDLQRRVQHYGYKYDYVKHKINREMYIAPLPDWALKIATKLHQNYSPSLPDQVIVNEYEPGQGITSHTDCKNCFRDTIISLSLGAECVMDFTYPSQNLKQSILLESRSLIIMQGEARYNWMHGIAKRKSDKFQGQVFKRARRVSLTFRTVIIPD